MLTTSLILAIIMTESSFNPKALSSENALGLMQITDIARREVEQTYKLPPVKDLTDPQFNILYGVLLLQHYAKGCNNERELLANYNGGYRQRDRLRSGLPLAPETARYIDAVLARRDTFSSMAGLRNIPYAGQVSRTLATVLDGGTDVGIAAGARKIHRTSSRKGRDIAFARGWGRRILSDYGHGWGNRRSMVTEGFHAGH